MTRVAATDQRRTIEKEIQLIYSLTGLDKRVGTAAEVWAEVLRREPVMSDNEEKTVGHLL